MIDLEKEYIYNLEYVVCLPTSAKDYLESFEYSFGNVVIINNNIEDIKKINYLMKKSNIKAIIFVNYYLEYNHIINNLDSNIIIYFVFTHSISSLSDYTNSLEYYGIMDLYNRNIINKLAFLDYSLYSTYKNKNNVFHITLDISKKVIFENTSKNSIGILNSPTNPRNSFYNSLSAVAMTKKYEVKFNSDFKEAINFCNIFNIKFSNNNENNFNNILNIYINFADSINHTILKSMDSGVPCLIGNSTIFDNNKFLKEQLVMKSDDDIDEINAKIDSTILNKNKIINEYNIFREKYSKESKVKIEEFLGFKKNDFKDDKSEKLLSVIVPVYNTSEYLEKCLESIVDAKIDDMEVIVINDGSTDDSEKIILSFVNQYPDLINYVKQTNKGLGAVRNKGLALSKGKYISSVDSDDTIEPTTYKESLPFLLDNVDIVIFDWNTILSDKENYRTPAIEGMLSKHNDYKALLFSSIMPSTCNKIFKKNLFTNNGIEYIEKLKYEDLATNIFPLLEAKSIKYISKSFYNYLIRQGSIMRSKVNFDMLTVLNILNQRLNSYFKLKNLPIEFLNQIIYYVFSWRIENEIINYSYNLETGEREKYINHFYQSFLDLFMEFSKNKYYINYIEALDEETKKYVISRNKQIISKKFEEFIEKQTNIKKLSTIELLEYYKD